jgi:Fe-S cluster assembly protein SufD
MSSVDSSLAIDAAMPSDALPTEMVPDVANARVSTKVDRAQYLADLLQLRSALVLEPLQDLRDRATARVQELAIPSTRDEEWRFTDLSPLLPLKFQAPSPIAPNLLVELSQNLPAIREAQHCLVFVNGLYQPQISSPTAQPGLQVQALSHCKDPAFVAKCAAKLGTIPGADNIFTALNSASVTDAGVIWVSQNQVVQQPIAVLYISTSTATAQLCQPRCLVVVESGAQLTLVEDFISVGPDRVGSDRVGADRVGADRAPVLTNAVTELDLAPNAQLTHTRVQREAHSHFHIGKTAVSQAQDSRYSCVAVTLGSAISRHQPEVYQMGPGIETTLLGLTMLDGDRTGDTHSTIAYNHPHGTANQVNKCIVGDRAHGVFNGKVLVPKPAQLTNASQLSRNLILSPKARIDTKPQLEITADNVKCAHGATVSQLEDDQVFYLQSRGLAPEAARRMLTYGFAVEVIDQIPAESLRSQLRQAVTLGLGERTGQAPD